MFFPNGPGVTAKVAQERFYASLQSAFGPGWPERAGMFKSGVSMQEGPGSDSSSRGVVRLPGDIRTSFLR
jgi:hypothetical protein